MGERGQKEFAYIRSDQAAPTGNFFYIKEHILCPGRTEYAVPQEFCCHDVGRTCGEFARVIDEVTSGRDADAVGISFLGAVVDDNSCVRYRAIFGDIGDIGGVHDKHCICTRLARLFVTLGHPPEVFAEGFHPDVPGCGVIHEMLVAADVFASNGVDHGHRVVGVVNNGGGFTVQLCWNEVRHVLGEVIEEELVDGFLADESRVAGGDSIGPAWGDY